MNYLLLLATINSSSIISFLLNTFFTLIIVGLIISLVIYIGGIAWSIILLILQIAFIPIHFLFITLRLIGNCIVYFLAFVFVCFQKITKKEQQPNNNSYANSSFDHKSQKQYQSNNSHQQQSNDHQEKQNDYYYSNSTDNLEKYRKILGVKKGDSKEEIKKHYREMVKQYHPDKNHNPQASTKFKEIVNAYEHLVL